MKKLVCAAVLLLVCAVWFLFPGAAREGGKVEIYFFYDTACASCNGEEEFNRIVEEVLAGEEEYPYAIHRENIFHSSGRKVYEAVTQEFGLDPNGLENPVCIVNGRALQGFEEIRKDLKEAYLTAGEDIFLYHKEKPETGGGEQDPFADMETEPEHATVLYFYRATCEECIQTKSVIDGIPDTFCMNGRWTQVDVLRLNTRSGTNGEKISRLFEIYEVPEEEQMVPIVFLADEYLAGYDTISARLQPLLEKGAGLGFSLPE